MLYFLPFEKAGKVTTPGKWPIPCLKYSVCSCYDCTSVVISELHSGSLRPTSKRTSEMASLSGVFLSKQTKSSFY